MADPPWYLDYYKDARGHVPVEEWLESLEVRHRARVKHTIGLLLQFGLSLGMPHRRHVSGKIWELRTSVGRINYRILYFAGPRRTFVLLHGFAKQGAKTPKQAIDVAKARAAEYEAMS